MCVRGLNGMTERYHTVKCAGGASARRESKRLLGLGLQEVDKAVVVEGFERRHGSASLRSDAGDVAAKEQSDSGG